MDIESCLSERAWLYARRLVAGDSIQAFDRKCLIMTIDAI